MDFLIRAALKGVEILHRKGELDEHLRPKKLILRPEDDEEDQADEEGLPKVYTLLMYISIIVILHFYMSNSLKAGTKKRRRYYPRDLPECLKFEPQSGSDCYIYQIETTLIDPLDPEENIKRYKIDDLKSPRKLGILVTQKIPLDLVRPFHLYIYSGKVKVELKLVETKKQLTLV